MMKKPQMLILNLVPLAIGLLLILRNLVATDMFNIGIGLMFLSVANILNANQK
ncbi:hypothetical protein ACFL0D_03515 [Thermoproteota archaeon]